MSHKLLYQELSTRPEHASSPPVIYSAVRVARSLVLWIIVFPFSFGHCIVCPSIHGTRNVKFHNRIHLEHVPNMKKTIVSLRINTTVIYNIGGLYELNNWHWTLQCFIRLYLQLFVGGIMFYLRYLCLFPYSGANRYCVVFLFLFFFVLCTVPYVASVSGLSIYDCPFGIL
jgi:hypothetical protein